MRKAGVVEFTGERYVPELDEPEISFEHWHRYLWSVPLCAGKRVLDVACGEGYGAALLAETAAQVTGVDADAETIAHARDAYARDNLAFRCGPAQDLPLPGDEVFDVVVSFETIEHLSEEDQRRFLAEVRRVLTPDGVALFSTPNRTVYTDRPRYHNPYHLKEFYPNEFRAVLGRSFAHVRLLGQRMFGASYLWPLDADAETLREYQLDYQRGAYVPASGDQKEAVYVIAVCSDRAIKDAECSILVDAADRMMNERRASAPRLREQEQTIKELRTVEERAHLLEDQAAAQEAQITMLGSQAATQEAHIAMLADRNAFLGEREQEARRLLVGVHEQLALRDADHRALLAAFEQQHRDLLKSRERSEYLSSELIAVAAERAETTRRIAQLERDWHEKNAYIETLETAVRASPLTGPILFAVRAIQRLQRLVK